MSENNEYYSQKMKRLLEKADNDNKAQLKSGSPVADEEIYEDENDGIYGSSEDFSFEDNKRENEIEKPRNYEEKKARLEKATEEARLKEGKKYSKRSIFISFLLVLSILVIGSFCIYKLFFVINTIEVSGNERYTDEQILVSAGIKTGENLYSFSSRIAEGNIKMYCPNVKQIEVTRKIPGKIIIKVTEEEPVFYCELYGEIRALTGELRVLGSITEEKTDSLIKLLAPNISRAVAGEKILFKNSKTDYVYEVALAVSESGLSDRIGVVDVRNSSAVKMVCDGKYLLKLESYRDAAAKLALCEGILLDDMFKTGNKAIIDLSDLSEQSVIPDNSIDLNLE